jgi:hypothetical protein
MKLTRSRRDSLLSALSKMASVSRAIVREIFDESAYERFLGRHQLSSSAAAYERFCSEREKVKVGPTRCC